MSVNIEVSLINAILTSNHIIPAIKKLTPEYFLNPTIQEIYVFLAEYFKKYKSVPSITAVNEKFSDFEYQEESGDVNYWVDEVIQKKCSSDLTTAILDSSNILQEKGGIEALDFLKQQVLELTKTVTQQEDVDITKDVEKRFDRYIDKAVMRGITGVPCGLPQIDNITSGFQPGELISLMGLPGMGKSFLATFFAKSAWEAGYKPLFISLEMGAAQVAERFDSLAAQISHVHLKRGNLNQEELTKYQRYLEELKPKNVPFIITTPSRCTQSVVLAKIAEHRPDICFIDYSRLMIDERGGKEHKAIGNIVSDLKRLAGDEKVHIPILLLSQVHRGFERTREELPDLHNIAENFMIVADSDLVIACHATDAMKEDNQMLVGIQKHRDGRNIKLRLNWDLDRGIIEEQNYP